VKDDPESETDSDLSSDEGEDELVENALEADITKHGGEAVIKGGRATQAHLRRSTAHGNVLGGVRASRASGVEGEVEPKGPTTRSVLNGTVRVFSAEIYTRGCHWIPRMFA
jgi:hypothetical protein